MDKIQVILATGIYELQSNIKDTLAQIEHILLYEPAKNLEELEQALNDFPADVVLLDSSLNGDGFKVTEALLKRYPQLAIIIIEEAVREDTFHKAMVAGASDLLIYPFDATLLNESIVRSTLHIKQQQLSQAGASKRQLPRNQKAFVITVFSPKGGVGKTSTAVNIAVSIHKQTKAEVVLLDLDLDFGNVALAMGVTPRYTLTDIVNDIHNISTETIMSYLTPHDSGVQILPVSPRPQLEAFITEKHVKTVIETLRDTCDYIVIDMPSRFYEPVNPALFLADKLIFVTTPELSSLRNAKAAMIALDETNYPKEKISVVLNRANINKSINARDVTKTLEKDIYCTLRDDVKLIIQSQNEGKPLVTIGKKRGLSADYLRLSNKVLQEFGQELAKKKKKAT